MWNKENPSWADSDVIESQVGVLEAVEFGVGFGREEVLPVSDLAFPDELHLVVSLAVDLLPHEGVFEDDGFEVDALVLLHLLELHVVAYSVDVVVAQRPRCLDVVGTLADDGRQVTLHFLVLHQENIRLMTKIIKVQHVLTRRAINHLVLQEHIDEVVERTI